MTTLEHGAAAPVRRPDETDLRAWPDLAAPRPAPIRAAIAGAVLRRTARRTGLRVEIAGRRGFGPVGGPVMRIHNPDAFFTRVGRAGKIGFGEAYMAGEWDPEGDLALMLEPMARSIRHLVPERLQWIRRFYEPRPPDTEENDLVGARRNISRHYDLSNEMFSLFLDSTMTYSSALFESPEDSLEQAQARKIDRLLDAARVTRGTRLLEIGTGWGELALRAAARGATVKTITLSQEQAELARRRVADAGVGDRVDIVVEDYRQTTGTFDSIVSVEMIEAVGERWWPTFFRVLDERLAPGGRIAIQAILMQHAGLVAARNSWTWIHKYIFPGGIIPSMEAIQSQVADHTRLRLLQRQHFGSSYAETLRRWRERFLAASDSLAHLGFDRHFRRMWEFYLAYSEAGFRSGYLDVAQIVLGRGEL